MQGVIYVSEYMQRQQRLQDWQERMRRNVEWYALKAYWYADDAGKEQVHALYGELLTQALEKWYWFRYKRHDVEILPSIDRQPNT